MNERKIVILVNIVIFVNVIVGQNSMFGFGKKKEEEEKWALVHTMPIDIECSNPHTGRKDEGKLYFYLYESNKGKRKEKHECSIGDNNSSLKRIGQYWEIIVPWLEGVDFTNISTYWDTVKEKQKKDVHLIYERMLKY